MKKSILHLILSLAVCTSACSFAQTTYDNGIFNGKYLSTYSNGNTKATGKIENNQRVGNWEFYSESGDLVAKINYQSNTEFKTLETQNRDSRTLNVPLNEFDKLYLLPLEEENVVWAQRMYRDIPAEEFGLTSDFNFFEFLRKVPTDKTLCYAEDQFQTQLPDIRSIAHVNEVICGYRIKLDYFIRKDFNFMDCRIVGIAPLYKTPDGKVKEICWLYYHGLKDQVFEKIVNKERKSMETILQTRSYHSTIYKEMNVSDKTLEEVAPDENERKSLYREIDQSLIETENNYILKCYF